MTKTKRNVINCEMHAWGGFICFLGEYFRMGLAMGEGAISRLQDKDRALSRGIVQCHDSKPFCTNQMAISKFCDQPNQGQVKLNPPLMCTLSKVPRVQVVVGSVKCLGKKSKTFSYIKSAAEICYGNGEN